MAEKIFIADKTTLDAVKVDTTSIKSATTSISSGIGSVNSAINQVNTTLNDKFDLSKVVPFNRIGKLGAYVNTLQTVYSVNGKGFLSTAFINSVYNDGQTTGLKVTIDGTVVFEGSYYNTSGEAMGIFNPSLLTVGSDNNYLILTPSGRRQIAYNFIRQHPNISQTANQAVSHAVILDTPLQFKSSLKIEGKGNEPTYLISGGLY